MDNITHTLFAATLANTRLRAAGPGTTAALILASNAPDIDIITAFTSGGAGYLAMHRGPTHGPLGLASLALATAAIVRLFNGRADLGRIAGVALLGTLLHVAMDVPTVYGTRFLSPFSATWFAFDWLPIIDIYLWAILVIGVFVARWRSGARGRIAAYVLIAMAANYALHAVTHDIALDRGIGSVPGPTMPCEPVTLERWRPLEPYDRPPRCVTVAALPSFLSPFTWRIVERHPDGYRMQELDLLVGAALPRIDLPTESNAVVSAARRVPEAARFLEFARMPVARSNIATDGQALVTFADARFMGNPLRVDPDEAAEPRTTFAVTVKVPVP